MWMSHGAGRVVCALARWMSGGALLVSGIVLTGCGSSECPEGRVEVDGICVVAGGDSGRDAAMRDSGAVPPDAGSDAGNEDDSEDAGGGSPCRQAQCSSHATCAVEEGVAFCKCKPGYEGDGGTCHPNECRVADAGTPDPCGANARCEDPSAAEGDVICSCEEGFASCDGEGDPDPGCETDLATTAEHCGSCELACADGLQCEGGRCDQAASKLVLGPYVSCALLQPVNEDGAAPLRCWGSNRYYELRDGAVPSGSAEGAFRAEPARLQDIDVVRGVTMGRSSLAQEGHVCVLDDKTDAALCWGTNGLRQLSSADQNVPLHELHEIRLSGAVSLAAGEWHTCALISTGIVRCWGSNTAGELGHEFSEPRSTVGTPVEVDGIDDAVQVAAGGVLSCARRAGGRVSCWGGPLESTSPSPVPVQNERDEPLAGATHVDVGGNRVGYVHACAALDSGNVACWGDSPTVELIGVDVDSEGSSSTRAALVPGLSNVVDVAVGNAHICALEEEGQVYCLGRNPQGILAVDSDADPVDTPRPVVDADDIIDIEAAGDHTCARRRTGQVVCWGGNDVGQLGDGTIVLRQEPRDVVGLP